MEGNQNRLDFIYNYKRQQTLTFNPYTTLAYSYIDFTSDSQLVQPVHYKSLIYYLALF